MKNTIIICIAIIGMISGCSVPSTVMSVQEINPSESIENVGGLGIESKDIVKMTREMVQDILSYSLFSNKNDPPSIIIDDKRFLNESNQIINISILIDRLRIELMRSSQGRLEFVSRKNMDLAQEEKMLEMQGYTERENSSDTIYLAGAKYRMIGKITSLSTASNSTGIKSNYYQFFFEIIDLDTAKSVWGNIYEIKKVGADDTLYN